MKTKKQIQKDIETLIYHYKKRDGSIVFPNSTAGKQLSQKYKTLKHCLILLEMYSPAYFENQILRLNSLLDKVNDQIDISIGHKEPDKKAHYNSMRALKQKLTFSKKAIEYILD